MQVFFLFEISIKIEYIDTYYYIQSIFFYSLFYDFSFIFWHILDDIYKEIPNFYIISVMNVLLHLQALTTNEKLIVFVIEYFLLGLRYKIVSTSQTLRFNPLRPLVYCN